MLEVIIEQWSNPDGSVDYLWSVWRDGRRIEMSDMYDSLDEAEAEARAYCSDTLMTAPDRVTHL
jgi:hypothetical protein